MQQEIDGVQFNTHQLFIYLVNHFGLSEEAKQRNVEMALTLDGAPLDDKTGYVMIGFKIVDKISIDPPRGQTYIQ
jgi:hypothetical protein